MYMKRHSTYIDGPFLLDPGSYKAEPNLRRSLICIAHSMRIFKSLALLCVVVGQSLLAAGFANPIKQTDGSDPFMVHIAHTRTVVIIG